MLVSVVRHLTGGREESMLSESLPLVRCKKCGIGTMLPLSDYGQEGAAILYKAWVCDSPTCGYNLRIDRAQLPYGDLPQPNAPQHPRARTPATGAALISLGGRPSARPRAWYGTTASRPPPRRWERRRCR